MNEILQAWLTMQCQLIAGASRALLVIANGERHRLQTVAVWPDANGATARLTAAAEMAASRRRHVVQDGHPSPQDAPAGDVIAAPLVVGNRLLGVIALEMSSRGEQQRRMVAKLLKVGAAWLEVLVNQRQAARNDHLAAVIGLLAECLEKEHFQEAAAALVNQMAARMACSRVSLGVYQRNYHRVVAISHTARIDRRSNLARDIAAAMDEAGDQGCSLVYPAPEGRSIAPIAVAHGELAKRHRCRAICSVPLQANGRVTGTITLERIEQAPFDQKAVRLCEQIALLVGPVLDLKQRDERSLPGRIWDAVDNAVKALFGPSHLPFKLGAVLSSGLVLFLALATGPYRVTADAVVEPEIQRAVAAPKDGYVASALLRAGDLVSSGDMLATLDNRDLKLEQMKWQSAQARLVKEYRSAFAAHDRSKVNVLKAQIEQADAELGLLAEQLSRSELRAPFDGIVVSGDLSRSLGSPVGQGDVLFEIAPLDAYRVALQIDEREIRHIRVGQSGHLTLAALPDRPLPLIVARILPVAEAADQRNSFRIEARLAGSEASLRPGMAGVAKIEIEQRSLAWIWTHRLFDWVSLQLWFWWL